jgi:hypothetical protein
MLYFLNVITDQMIPRIKGDALGTNGFEMEPNMLQGDHLPKENKSFIITLAK